MQVQTKKRIQRLPASGSSQRASAEGADERRAGAGEGMRWNVKESRPHREHIQTGPCVAYEAN
jgi:hypothetical protein